MSQIEKSDGALLAEFTATGRQEPFCELVRRHRTLVWNACRRVLGRAEEAEDAAQAVFVTLAHKAKSLQGRASVAGWLHHVAWYIARRLKEAIRVRRTREREAAEMKEAGQHPQAGWDEVGPVLDQELDALPDKYRLALILRYLEGLTEEATAKQLGWKTSTLSMRLLRGKELLRERLTRRGVAVTGAVLLGLLTEKAASAAAVSEAFTAFAAKAAAMVAAGKGVEGVVSTQVGALVKGGLKAMMWTKIKIAAAVMAVSLAGTGGGVVAYQALAPEQEPKAETAKAPAVPKGLPPEIPVEKFKKIHETIKPYPGEFAWLDDVPWEISIQAAREKAAAEEKMVVVWTAAAGHPLGHT